MKFFTNTSGADAPDEIPMMEHPIIFSIGTTLPEWISSDFLHPACSAT